MAGYFYPPPPTFTGGSQPYQARRFVPPSGPVADAPPVRTQVLQALIRAQWEPAPYAIPRAGTVASFLPVVAAPVTPPFNVNRIILQTIIDQWQPVNFWSFGPDGTAPFFNQPLATDAPPPRSLATDQVILDAWRPQTHDVPRVRIAPLIPVSAVPDTPPPPSRVTARVIRDAWIAPFQLPPTPGFTLLFTTVPNVVGAAQASGTTTLQNAGFVVAVVNAYDAVVAVGNIISQNPAASAVASNGSTVTITVSVGPDPGASGSHMGRFGGMMVHK